MGVDRASYRYEPRPDRDAELREELVKLARQKPRYGYRRLHAVLERHGQAVNVKRVYRLYTEQGLAVRRRKRKRLVREQMIEPRLLRANQEWANEVSRKMYAPTTGQSSPRDACWAGRKSARST